MSKQINFLKAILMCVVTIIAYLSISQWIHIEEFN